MDEEKIALVFVIVCALFVACVVLFTANAGDKVVSSNLLGLWTATAKHDIESGSEHQVIIDNLDELRLQTKTLFDEQVRATEAVAMSIMEEGNGPLRMTAKEILSANYAAIFTDDSRNKFRVIACNDARCFGEDS